MEEKMLAIEHYEEWKQQPHFLTIINYFYFKKVSTLCI